MAIEYSTDDFFPHQTAAVTVFRRRRVTVVLPHFHDFDEVIVVLRGRGEHVVDGRMAPFTEGDVLLVRAGQTHYYRQARDMAVACVLVMPGRLAREYKVIEAHGACFELARQSPCHVHLSGDRLPRVMHCLRRIEEHPWPQCAGAVAELFSTLRRAMLARQQQPTVNVFDEDLNGRLAPAIGWLERHFADLNALEPLSDLTHMSNRNLLRRFHQVTGRSPVGYLGDLRLHRAMLALKRSRTPILEVAMETGFHDLSYFYRRFVIATGRPPRQWRRNPVHVW